MNPRPPPRRPPTKVPTMFRKTLIAALALTLPLWALAEGPAPAAKAGKKPAATAATAAAPASAGAVQKNRMVAGAALQRNQSRGAAMGACTKKAADQKLEGLERKQFIAGCVNGQ